MFCIEFRTCQLGIADWDGAVWSDWKLLEIIDDDAPEKDALNRLADLTLGCAPYPKGQDYWTHRGEEFTEYRIVYRRN